MSVRNVLGSATLFLSLAGAANAQSLAIDVTKTARPDENHTLTMSGSYGPVSGFIDSFGRDWNGYYTEVYGRKNVSNIRGRKYGFQAELNKGSADFTPATGRAGIIGNIVSTDKLYASTKLLPLTITKNGIKKEVQLSGFGSVNLPKGFYAEGWIDHNFGVDPFTNGVITAGKMFGRLGIEGQYARNVNSDGNAFRFGGRYKIR